MWNLLIQALKWAGTIGLGWMSSDIYNEYSTNSQIGVAGATKTAYTNNGSKWIMGTVIVAIFAFLLFSIIRLIVKLFKK